MVLPCNAIPMLVASIWISIQGRRQKELVSAMSDIIPQNMVQCTFNFDALSTLPFEQIEPVKLIIQPQAHLQRQCTACLESLPATTAYFRRQVKGLYGLRSICKKCEKAKRKSAKTKAPEGYKICIKCRQMFPATSEYFSKSTRKGMQLKCKKCDSVCHKAAMNTYKYRAKVLRRHGITPEQYDQMLAQQGYVCACCKCPETRIAPKTRKVIPLSVDHNHSTGKVRALLCHHCNAAYGNLREDPERIKALLRYHEWCQENA